MQQNLRRDLGLPQVMLTVIGIVIGSGIFALPAIVFAQAQAPGLGLFSWFVGGLMSLAAGLTVAELAAAMPRAGGSYVFLTEAYGEVVGFLQGWAQFLAYNSALQAALAMLFTTYLTALIPLSSMAQKVVGLILITILTVINSVGVRFGGMIQVVSTIGKLVPIGLLILVGLPHAQPANFAPLLPTTKSFAAGLAGAVLPILWAYDGWLNVGMLAEEVRDPQRNLPRALIGGLAVVTVVYALFNAALIGVIPIGSLVLEEKPVVPMAQLLFGNVGAKMIAVGMLISMLGTLNAIVMTAPRYYYAMARDGLFPWARMVSQLHARYQTPVVALVLSYLWSIVLLFSGQFGQLLNLVVLVSWLFYVLTMIAVFVLRKKRPEMKRPYKAWGYPVVPLIGILSGIWIVWNSFQNDPWTSVTGLVLTLSGLPVYWFLRRTRTSAPSTEK